ncbi:MAG TPA: VIT1/CCC1 transporter family protein [Solirubrobacterales bacterium]
MLTLLNRARGLLAGDDKADRNPHDARATGTLRPIVFGANDGLVSNLALVMGVAGAAPEPGIIVLAGIAGLLAGAFSMGVGEYISVQSQQELLAYHTDLQRRQLVDVPEQERRILVESYTEKGFSPEEAAAFADRVFRDSEHAVSLMLHTEVGLDARSIGSPWAAAGGSFLAFTLGALVPLVPYLLSGGTLAFVASLGLSLAALGMLGAGISILTHRQLIYAAVRQVLLGGAAAGVTYMVGAAVGVSAA